MRRVIFWWREYVLRSTILLARNVIIFFSFCLNNNLIKDAKSILLVALYLRWREFIIFKIDGGSL
jgi:hypothetical protein